MKKEIKQTLDEYNQIFYNFAIPGSLFLAVGAILISLLYSKNGGLPTHISIFDFIVISLASYRMIKGASTDKLTRYIREAIKYDVKVVEENGQKFMIKTEPAPGIRTALMATIECVWCIGFWTTLITLFLYFISPETYIIILLFAIAGVASLFQLFANLIATKYEELDMKNDETVKNLNNK